MNNEILWVYCPDLMDMNYWLGKQDENYRGEMLSSPLAFYEDNSNWKELKNNGQIISVSYDVSKEMYLIVFRRIIR